MALETAPAKPSTYKFTVGQFEQMILEGVFAPAERIELIDGEILKISPINHPHAAVVSNLEYLFRGKLGRAAYVWAQQPIVLDDRSRPQPDVVLLKWRDDRYIPHRPSAEDVVLLVEVSDSSLTEDRRRKKDRYARSSIPEYWIVNLQEKVVEVYLAPIDGEYTMGKKAAGKEILILSGGPTLGAGVSVDEIFGDD